MVARRADGGTHTLTRRFAPPFTGGRGIYLTLNPSRGSKRLPSSRIASTQIAAGEPSFIGRPVIFSFVPALKSLGRIPDRCRVLGPSASNPHVVMEPFLFFTSTSSHECGFVN